jgi:hypothetical protein
MMKYDSSPAMMITEEDIEELVREWAGVPEWIKAHLAAKYSAHRYEGEAAVDSNRLLFRGRDIKERKGYDLEIPFDSIEEVYLGFSKYLKSGIDLTFGMGGPTPLAVRYRAGDREKIAYFNIGFDNYVPHITMNNRRLYEELNIIIKGQKRSVTRSARRLVAV